MATLASAVIDRFQRIFPDCSDTVAIDYLNEVHADLLSMLPLVVTTEDITLVASTQEYSLNESTIRVWSAYYYTSATDFYPLKETDVSELDITQPAWRNKSAGRPSKFYIWRNTTDHVVGFDPKPSTATSGTYPKITLHVSRLATLTSSDNVAKSIKSIDTYVFGMARRFALDKKRDEYDLWDKRYQEKLNEEKNVFFGKNVQSKPAIIPTFLPGGGVVR